jgi:hypothetical protein
MPNSMQRSSFIEVFAKTKQPMTATNRCTSTRQQQIKPKLN